MSVETNLSPPTSLSFSLLLFAKQRQINELPRGEFLLCRIQGARPPCVPRIWEQEMGEEEERERERVDEYVN